MKNNDVVILIPSYEPDKYLVNTVKELVDNNLPVLVVNDGSSSEYEPIFDQIKKDAKYIRYDINRGKGGALKEGFKNIPTLFPEAKYVITADGDGQHATKDIIRMYELLKEKDELILGIRCFDKTVPFRSRFGNEWTKLNRTLLTKQYLQDDQCGLRGFPVRYIPELLEIKGNRYDYEINQLTSFQLRDYHIETMPIDVIYIENNSRSHFKNVRDTAKLHFKIIYKGLPALFCLMALIGSLITLYHFNYSYHHLMVFPVYLVTTLFYIGLLSIFEPSRTPARRMFKELIYSIIKMTFVFLMMYLFIDAFGMSFYISIPLLVIVACIYNVLLPRVIK